MADAPPSSRFPVLILAAGASRRMGRSKAMLSWGEGSLLDHAMGQGLCLGPRVWVVAGCRYPLLRYRCRRRPYRWLFNERWPEGMASSLQTGLAALPVDVPGCFVLLVDQPLIAPASLQALAAAAEARPDQPVAADHGGRPGVPAYLPRGLWPELMELRGDRGAAQVLRRKGAHTIRMAGCDRDLDTPAQWRRWRSLAFTGAAQDP
ncbi:MAG: nucleotidyltransferase family protein [Marinobacter sp.]|uniref:nucleotidyltransferase family protein n=1 Tax=Marinobacter sp. TaxID=50741 RepID=UPI00299F0232|nr:nucleotidyltransferase family protein [Marinobacter sp.]MDX1633388.1 nucleotidyltransferase family protein [Marinobacter sp.]